LVKSTFNALYTPTALKPIAQGRRFGAPWVTSTDHIDPEGVGSAKPAPPRNMDQRLNWKENFEHSETADIA
jgi:hypothetical protein